MSNPAAQFEQDVSVARALLAQGYAKTFVIRAVKRQNPAATDQWLASVITEARQRRRQ